MLTIFGGFTSHVANTDSGTHSAHLCGVLGRRGHHPPHTPGSTRCRAPPVQPRPPPHPRPSPSRSGSCSGPPCLPRAADVLPGAGRPALPRALTGGCLAERFFPNRTRVGGRCQVMDGLPALRPLAPNPELTHLEGHRAPLVSALHAAG